MEELKLEIREIPIVELVENTGQIPDVPANPRKISKEKFKALCDSIKMSPEMKALDEVKVYPYDGKYVVISGNHRCRAYRHLKWTNVLCKVLPADMPKEKLREYVIKENMQYAENDEKLLSSWDIKELVLWDVPMKMKGGGKSEDWLRSETDSESIRKQWLCVGNGGGQIIKLDETNKGHTNKQKIFDYNPIVRIPIKGV